MVKSELKSIKNGNIRNLVLKYSIISSVLVLILADLYNSYMHKFVNYLMAPIVNLDLNDDGEPDINQLKQYQLNIFGRAKFPLGLFLYNLVILIVKVMVLFYIIKLLIKYVVE